MQTKTMTPEQKITVLKHLINDRDVDWIATATSLTHDQIGDVQRDHGYPDPDKMRWALDIIEKRNDTASATATITARPSAPVPERVAREQRITDTIRPDLSRAQAPVSTPVPTATPDTIGDLLAKATKSTHGRTRNLAAKVTAMLEDLGQRLADEEQAREQRAKAAAAEAKRRTRIAELEAEIAALKGKDVAALKQARTTGNGNLDSGRGAKYGEYTCDADECGRTFDTAQGVALHRRRAHEGYDPNAARAAS